MNSVRRQFAFATLLFAFLTQALIPVGFMPGRLSDGELVTFCPAGVPAEFMAALHGDAHHHHQSDQESAFEQCDIGGGGTDLVSGEFEPLTAKYLPLPVLDGTAAAEQFTQYWPAKRPRDPPKLS